MKLPPIKFDDWGDVFLFVTASCVAVLSVCGTALAVAGTVYILTH
jgi:hypothetical protein